MKKILLMLLAINLGMGASFAQKAAGSETIRQYTPEERTMLALRQLTTKLNLTEEQMLAIKPYLGARETARESFLSNREDEQSINAFKEARSNFHAALKGMLTSEQMVKWQEIKGQRKEQIQNRKSERNPDRHFDPEEF